MEWIVYVNIAIKVLEYLDSRNKKKITTKQLLDIANEIGGDTKKAANKANKKGDLANLLWIVNWLLGKKK